EENCEQLCATCDFSCWKLCSSDDDCVGYADSAGNPLSCSSCPGGVCNSGFKACDIDHSSGAGGGVYDCSAQGDVCSCTASSAANDTKCDDTSFTDAICCADSGWPSSGTCACRPSANCVQQANGNCSCSYENTTSSVVDSCSATGSMKTCCTGSTGCYCWGG